MRLGVLCIVFFWGQFAFSNNSKLRGEVSQRVVYGDDDRKDLYQVTDAAWVTKAASTIAMMDASRVQKSANGYTIDADTYGKVYQLCKDEPFYNQTHASFCSASLIAPDIAITAGHCVTSTTSCQKFRYVFNYAYRTENGSSTEVGDNDVYSCKELIRSTYTSGADFAIIRLDRRVVGHAPLGINRAGKIRQGDGLVLIGNPAGLPTKVAAGAKVIDDSNNDYFVADTDSYGGNSGSAVFNSATGLIEGILVRGEKDFNYKNGCYYSNTCKGLEDCRGEDVTRIEEVMKYLPSAQ